jgi:7,8-dihydropterin-6-yl-methyl-4-(beta-D-ribofuranosyl)aminobenzene 5'-phosphate synthase
VTQIDEFGDTAGAIVTVLVDNRADLIVRSTGTVRYFTDKPLLAEHGLAMLIELQEPGLRVLWDAGLSEIALPENMRRMEIDPASIDLIAISHGHRDHTGAITAVLKAMNLTTPSREWPPGAEPARLQAAAGRPQVPLVVHPAAFRERWSRKDDGGMVGPFSPPPRAEWEAIGAQLVLSEGPHRLAPGCWTTGAVPRLSFEQSGRSSSLRYRQGARFRPDDIEEDQAVVINLRGRGLLVVSGCAHAGIVNTVEYARAISGVDRVWAVLGGFHLARAEPAEIQQTLDAVRAWAPALVSPLHCTGFEALGRFAAAMPDQFVRGLVGTTYLF